MVNVIVSALLWVTYLISLYFAVFWLIVFFKSIKEPQKKKMTCFPFVSFVMPVWNKGNSIKKTLENAISINYPKDHYEIIIVNDGSTDNSFEIAKEMKEKYPGSITHLLTQENKGKGAAMNAGIKMSKGEYIVCLDADSFVEKDYLKKILPYFSSEDVAVVLPYMKVFEPKTLLEKIQRYEYVINMFYKEIMGRINCIHVVSGPFSIYKKDILVKVGGFVEGHNLTEDLEIALRLQKNNYKLIQLLNIDVETIVPNTIKGFYAQRNRWYKGGVMNAFNYKDCMFSKKTGDFGIIQLPMIIIAGIMALFLITTMIYYSVESYASAFYRMHLVGWDFMTFIKTFAPNINILDYNFQSGLTGLIMLGITIYVIRKSHTVTKERLLKYGMVPLFIYLVFYFILLATVWIGVTNDLIRRKVQKW